MLWRRIHNIIIEIINWIMICFFIILFISVVLGILSRYVLRTPILWTGELSIVSNMYAVFLGAYILTLDRKHLRVDILKVKISEFENKKWINLYNLIIDIFVFCIIIVATVGSWVGVIGNMGIKLRTIPLPYSTIHFSVSISFTLMILVYINRLIKETNFLFKQYFKKQNGKI